MKIISRFKDFYDHVSRICGSDDKITYVRDEINNVEIKTKEFSWVSEIPGNQPERQRRRMNDFTLHHSLACLCYNCSQYYSRVYPKRISFNCEGALPTWSFYGLVLRFDLWSFCIGGKFLPKCVLSARTHESFCFERVKGVKMEITATILRRTTR